MNDLGYGAATRAGDIDGRKAWIRLVASIAFATLGGAGMWAVVVVLPSIQTEFGIDRAEASLPYTATMIGFALGNVVVGRLIDRYGFARPALLATLALAAGFALAATAPSITAFVAFQFLVGAGASASFGPLLADISHWFHRRRGLAVALAASGNYLAGAIWPIVLQAIVRSEGWRTAYGVVAVVCLFGMTALLLVLRAPPPKPFLLPGSAKSVNVRSLRTDLSPAALQGLLIVAGLGCCVAMSMPQVHIVAYCADLGYGVARGAEMLSLMLVGGIVSRILSGTIADRIGGIRTLLLGSLLQGISLMLFIPVDGLASLYAVSLIFGLAQGGIVPCYAIIVREYMPAAEAGRRVGIVITATIGGMALGGWMSGWIYDATGSYAAAFLNGIAWNVLNVTVVAFLLWRTRIPAIA